MGEGIEFGSVSKGGIWREQGYMGIENQIIADTRCGFARPRMQGPN